MTRGIAERSTFPARTLASIVDNEPLEQDTARDRAVPVSLNQGAPLPACKTAAAVCRSRRSSPMVLVPVRETPP